MPAATLGIKADKSPCIKLNNKAEIQTAKYGFLVHSVIMFWIDALKKSSSQMAGSKATHSIFKVKSVNDYPDKNIFKTRN